MLSKYIWSVLNSEVNALYVTFGFDKEIGLRAKGPAVVFLTFYEEGQLDALQELFLSLDTHAVLPFIHIIVGEEFNQDEYYVLMSQRDMTPINYSYEASSRMGLIVVEAKDKPVSAADAVLEMFNLSGLPLVDTSSVDMVEDGFDMELTGLVAEYDE
jgi:hypothetical protein